jgi:hypothetical protein
MLNPYGHSSYRLSALSLAGRRIVGAAGIAALVVGGIAVFFADNVGASSLFSWWASVCC